MTNFCEKNTKWNLFQMYLFFCRFNQIKQNLNFDLTLPHSSTIVAFNKIIKTLKVKKTGQFQIFRKLNLELI